MGAETDAVSCRAVRVDAGRAGDVHLAGVAMPVVSSTIVEDRVQRDGRRSVREAHTLDTGEIAHVEYLAEAKAVVEDMLPIRSALIDEQIAAQEVASKAESAADAKRAAAILKLDDQAIADILKVDVTVVADEKGRLADDAAKVDGKVDALAAVIAAVVE